MRYSWKQLDNPLRISTMMGFLAGVWLGFTIPFGWTRYYLLGITNPFFLIAFLPVFSLLFLGPIFGLVGSLVIFLVPMSSDRRGILGFMVFTGSLAPVVFLSLALLALLTDRPFFS